MTDDPFALLGLPARPVLDSSTIKEAHHRLAVVHHPDAREATYGFMARLNEARSIVEDVPARLRLLSSTRPPAATPHVCEDPDWAFAQRIASAGEAASAWAIAFDAASSPLKKAILVTELPAIRSAIDEVSNMLESHARSLEAHLHELDSRWPEVTRDELESLADAWTFWRRQHARVAESRLTLETTAPT